MARTKSVKRPWCLVISIALILFIIIAIVVPLAVILPKRAHHHQTSSILLPLYIYPSTNTTWSPLYAV